MDLNLEEWEIEIVKDIPVGKFQKDLYILYLIAQGHEAKWIAKHLDVSVEYIRRLRRENEEKIKEFQGYIVKETIFDYTRVIKHALRRAEKMLMDESSNVSLRDITNFLQLMFEKRIIAEASMLNKIRHLAGENASVVENTELQRILPRYMAKYDVDTEP